MEPDDYNEDETTDTATDMTDQSTQGVTRVQVQWKMGGDSDQDGDKTALQDNPPDNPFGDQRLHTLWDKGLSQNNHYWLIREAVKQGDRQLPLNWGLPISISECSVDGYQRLCWRDRIWVPHYIFI